MKQSRAIIFLAIIFIFSLVACSPDKLHTQPGQSLQSPPTGASQRLPKAVEYNLGETTIVQSIFSEDSRFYNMPVRLNGIIATPAEGVGPFPVVVIFHGNHPGCPIPPGDKVDRWPCDPEVEQRNYFGFDYLVRQLAGQGYIALSININAENTFGFGETFPGERLKQLVDLHLKALAEAAGGGENTFGVDLAGRADLHSLALIGHSRGGESAYWLSQDADLNSTDAFDKLGYGPVAGLLLLAPAVGMGGLTETHVPLAIVLPACDGDMMFQEGQHYYELTRMGERQKDWATSVWLEQANHNFFNEVLSDESMGRPGRPDCTTLLTPQSQRDFLTAYTLDFLSSIFSPTGQAQAALVRMGLDSESPAPDELYGHSGWIASLVPRENRKVLLLPGSAAELQTNLTGGSVTADGVDTHYCEEGYYTPMMKPGSEPCKRVNLTIPGNPAMVVASWSDVGAALQFSLPFESGDLSDFTALSLRAAVDPLSNLNKDGSPQAFSLRLTDRKGKFATVKTRTDEPALRFPPGYEEEDYFFEGGLFTGRVPLTTIRLPLSDFKRVDLSAIREVALVFDQSPSGSLFISDIEAIK